MPTLLRVVGHGQGTDPPARRKRARSAALSLTPEEARAVRAAARNVARQHFGTLAALARALGVAPTILSRKAPPCAGLAVALARVSGLSVDAVLGWKGLAVVQASPAPSAPKGGAA